MTTLMDALAQYVAVLSQSAQTTTCAEDRSAYTNHLAAAAEIFACLHSGRVSDAKAIVSDQKRAFGWGYLSGEAGDIATSAFIRFATIVEATHVP